MIWWRIYGPTENIRKHKKRHERKQKLVLLWVEKLIVLLRVEKALHLFDPQTKWKVKFQGIPGIEPGTYRSAVGCSTAELYPHNIFNPHCQDLNVRINLIRFTKTLQFYDKKILY